MKIHCNNKLKNKFSLPLLKKIFLPMLFDKKMVFISSILKSVVHAVHVTEMKTNRPTFPFDSLSW